jgi:diguanylate cyclase (GGDEF)-like protein
VADEARTLYNSTPKVESTDVILRKLTAQVTTTAINHTAKLCRLEKDVDQTKQGLNDLKFQAFTDPLTKVLNRRGFTQLAERRLEMASVQGSGVCCMLIDLDDFKKVNDTHGHDAGDLLLKGLARVFRKKLGPNDLIGRLGGDEFAVLIAGIDRARAYAVSQKLADSVEGREIRLRDDLTLRSCFTVGSIYTDICLDDLTIDLLLTLADQTMYQRKKNGKHGLAFNIYPDETPEAIHQEKNPHAITRTEPRM